MSSMMECAYLKKQTEGLAKPPFPGELGQKIFSTISKEAWQLWLNHQTMLINEYRLSLIDPEARTFLLREMENFLFGNGSEKPAGFVAKIPLD